MIPTTTTIHVVWADHGYEGREIVAAFFGKRQADDLCTALYRHAVAKPECPDMTAPDEEWEAYDKLQSEWAAQAPGGQILHTDSFYVYPLEVRGLDTTPIPC